MPYKIALTAAVDSKQAACASREVFRRCPSLRSSGQVTWDSGRGLSQLLLSAVIKCKLLWWRRLVQDVFIPMWGTITAPGPTPVVDFAELVSAGGSKPLIWWRRECRLEFSWRDLETWTQPRKLPREVNRIRVTNSISWLMWLNSFGILFYLDLYTT